MRSRPRWARLCAISAIRPAGVSRYCASVGSATHTRAPAPSSFVCQYALRSSSSATCESLACPKAHLLRLKSQVRLLNCSGTRLGDFRNSISLVYTDLRMVLIAGDSTSLVRLFDCGGTRVGDFRNSMARVPAGLRMVLIAGDCTSLGSSEASSSL